MNQIRQIVSVMLFGLLGLATLSPLALAVPEAPQPVTAEQLAAIVKSAPPLPSNSQLDLGLKLKLIDFIDCTNEKDPHGFMDQGTSTVTSGPAGKYRVTAAHSQAFFSYRFKSAGKDKPVLLVFEYPDDAVRTIYFGTHESSLTGGVNADWSLETGVYTGAPLPLTNQMQYHTFIWWPKDEWPCAIVASWHRAGVAAAASRIWAFAIEGPLPKLEVAAPEPANQRVLGHYNSIHFLPTMLYFGYAKNRNASDATKAAAIENMLDYFQYIGVNNLSWTVLHNNDWGFTCLIPSWDGGTEKNETTGHLDTVLKAMDAREGMSFTAGFCTEGAFTIGDKDINKMPPEELKAVLIKGFDEFLDRYGKYKSLKGITIGAQFGDFMLDIMNKAGITADLVAHLKEKCAAVKRPDIDINTYVGGKGLFEVYFNGDKGAEEKGQGLTTWDVISGWEKSTTPWSDWLGEKVLEDWKAWGRAPDDLRKMGLTLYEQLQPDDFRVMNYYGTSQDPHAPIYYDVDRSQKRSDLVNTPYAAIWNTHYEGHFGLLKDYNFWYTKLWVAPDFNAPAPCTLASFTRAMALRDRLAIVPGSWNIKYFGGEASYRRFAKAYRALPPVEMKDVAVTGTDTAKVRWVIHNGKRYISAMSAIPLAAELEIDGQKVALPPYELVSMVDAGKEAPKVSGQAPVAYTKWLTERLAAYDKLCQEVQALDAAAAPPAYLAAGQAARKLMEQGQPYAADLAAGFGLASELQLRKEILQPAELRAPKVAAAPPMNGDLGAWPKEASDLRADTGAFLARHVYFPNSWTGADDLSARLRLANDGQKLYIGLEVRDQKVTKEMATIGRAPSAKKVERSDGCSIRLSTKGYKEWRGMAVADDMRWSIAVPIDQPQTTGQGKAGFSYKATRTKTGYLVEGSVALADLKLQPGDTMGMLVQVTDIDGPMDDKGTTNVKATGWGAKQVLLIPCQMNFVYYDDARTCGQLVIEK